MKILENLESRFRQSFQHNCITNVYGTGRTIIALGTLSTMLFSSPAILFDKDLYMVNVSGTFMDSFNLFYLLGYEQLYLAYGLSVAILLLVASGYFPRWTGIPHWIVAFSFNNSCAIADGGDQVAMVLAFFLIPLTLMDSRKNHFHAPVRQNFLQNSLSVTITKFIIPAQMAVIYFHAAVDKLYKVEEWRNGTGLYYILEDPLFGSFPFSEWTASMLTNGFIVTSMTWGTILLEILLFGAVFMSYKRKKPFLFLGIAFHFMIIVFFGLVSFFCSMVGGLCIYLLDPEKPIDYGKIRVWLRRWSKIWVRQEKNGPPVADLQKT